MHQLSIQSLKDGIWPLWYRFRFFADLPGIFRILAYRKLRSKFYKEFWAEIATNIGAEIHFDGFGFTRINSNDLTTFVKQYQVMLDSPIMLDVMGNKGLTYQMLTGLGAPIVPHQIFPISDMAEAESFLAKHNRVVIKPSSGTGGGRGVTTGISSTNQLKSAARLAARFDKNLIIEKQVEGGSYRLLFLNGQFIDAIRRDPPVVVGDGLLTIKQLVKLENKHRMGVMPIRALSPLVIDKDAHNWLAEIGLSLSYVPDMGEVIQIKRAVNENNYSGNVNVTRQVNQDVISGCSYLVEKLGAKFVGVDLICKDISGPFISNNCLIGEINTTPGLHHHYLIANPEQGNPVAETLLEYMFSKKVGVMELGRRNTSLVPPGMYFDEEGYYCQDDIRTQKVPADGVS
jgi:D-alanine-D-alanine ligase-like ATP-grasp enzyme